MSQQNSQTIITKHIDGIEVIRGFGKLSIDPHETKIVAAVAIQSTDEFIAVKEKQDARDESARLAADENEKLKTAKKAKNKSDEDKYWKSREAYRNIAVSQEQEIKELLPALAKKRQEVMQSEAVYFEPKLGEYAKSDAEISDLRDVLASVQGSGFVDLSGNVLEDNRGAVHCILKSGKWTIVKIMTVGIKVPGTAVLYGDLDDSQRSEVDLQIETNHAAGMSVGQKSQARAAAEAKALDDSVLMRLQLESQSVSDALEQSQDWYNSRMAEIAEIYG